MIYFIALTLLAAPSMAAEYDALPIFNCIQDHVFKYSQIDFNLEANYEAATFACLPEKNKHLDHLKADCEKNFKGNDAKVTECKQSTQPFVDGLILHTRGMIFKNVYESHIAKRAKGH